MNQIPFAQHSVQIDERITAQHTDFSIPSSLTCVMIFSQLGMLLLPASFLLLLLQK